MMDSGGGIASPGVVDAAGSVPYPTRLADGTSVFTGTSALPLCL
jgi:hypothetical protein